MDLVISTLLLLLTWITLHALYSRITKPNSKLPPGPSPYPIIGNLLELGQKPHQSMAKLAKIHGPIMKLKLGQITTIVISSAEMAREVLQTNDQHLSNRTVPQAISVLDHELYSPAFSPVSPLWKEMRRIFKNQLFSHKNLDDSQHVRRTKVQELIDDIHKSSQIGEVVEIGTEVFKTTINMLSNTIFSMDLIHSTGVAGEFKDVVSVSMRLAGTPNLADFFPVLKTVDLQGIQRRTVKNGRRLLDLFDDLVNQRLKMREDASFERHNDMLDALLDISMENKMINKTMMSHIFFDLFAAATDTTTSTLEWAMTELLCNPEIMSKAKKELEETIGKGNAMDESDIARLPYLQAIVKETLRLHPPTPLLLPRKADKDVEVGGYIIPKDAQLFVNVWTICRDPTTWVNPMLFSPERFLGSNIDFKGQNFELVPFGGGRRICPGLPLADRTLALVLGSLVNSFDWKLENGMKPEDVVMDEKFGLTLSKAQPLRVIPFKNMQ